EERRKGKSRGRREAPRAAGPACGSSTSARSAPTARGTDRVNGLAGCVEKERVLESPGDAGDSGSEVRRGMREEIPEKTIPEFGQRLEIEPRPRAGEAG